MLSNYLELTLRFGCVPTFPITAVTLKRHPDLIRRLSTQGIEFALHGYIHTDYKSLNLEEQTKHFERAVESFNAIRIPFTGFRAPYLRISEETPKALEAIGVLYDSSHTAFWDVIEESASSKNGWDAYNRLLKYYEPRSADDYLVLPRFINGFVEMPVSIPDDEAMVDRLNIIDKREITRIWRTILKKTHDRGELFIVQLHHERINICENALANILQLARELTPQVWIETLGEIASWWKERAKFTLHIDHGDNGRYRVKANCTDRATVLLKNCKADKPVFGWSNGYQSIEARDFTVECPVRPVIGVNSDSSEKAVSFLKSEGFIVEHTNSPQNYGVYLDTLVNFNEIDEKPLSEKIEQLQAPLLRFWRWPGNTKSAMAVSGDIDSITLIDFVLRIFENWRQNGR